MHALINIIKRIQRAASSFGRSPEADRGLPLAQFGQGDQAHYIDEHGQHRIGDGLHRKEVGR